VTSPDVVLELRPPPLATALYCVSLVVAVVLVVVLLTTDGSPLFTAVFLAFVVGITACNTAAALSRARAHADGSLEVRNRLSTRRLARSDVDRVMLGRQGGFGSSRRLELLLTEGTTLPLAATETPPLPGQRRRLEEQAVELRRWLSDDAHR
jgi:multisubunit Na+/H+ antiporter MnhG subunit